MEDKDNSFETLIQRAEEYGKTSFEILKLKAIDRTTGVASSLVSRVVAVTIIFMFFLMGSLGVAFWLGDILGKAWTGFFLVASFYGIIGFVLFFFMHKWLKRQVGNSIIKQVLK
jgi:phosphoglycerol transferase MdoB-like AlkP superfamily enzyme